MRQMLRPPSIVASAAVSAASAGYALHDAPPPTADASAHLPTMLAGLLDVLCNPHLIAWVVLPIWVVAGILDARTTQRAPAMIRWGSHRRMLVDVAVRAALSLLLPTATAIVTALLLFAFVIRAGVQDGIPLGAERIFADADITPLAGAIGQVLFVWAFLIVLRLVLEIVATAFPFGLTVAFGAACYVWAGASSAGFIGLGPVADFRTYTVLTASLENGVPLLTVAAAPAFMLAAVIACAMMLDGEARLQRLRFPRWVWMGAGSFALVLTTTFALGTSAETLAIHVMSLFYGPTSTLVQLLFGIVVTGGFVLVALFRLERDLGEGALPALLRHGSRPRQLSAIARRELLTAGAVSGWLAAASVVAFVIAGGRDFTAPPFDAGLLIYQLTVGQTAQLTFFAICVAAVVAVTGSGAAGLGTVGVITVLSGVPVPPSVLVPWQRASTAVLFDSGWPTAVSGTLVLVTATAVAWWLAAHPDIIRSRLRLHAPTMGAHTS